MKPFLCDICALPVKIQDAAARWHYDKKKNFTENFQIIHENSPCNNTKNGYFNRKLMLDFVFKNIPEFLSYIGRFDHDKRELKNFIQKIEKDRSYIRRFNVDKKEVKKLVILLDGFGD